MRWFHLAATGSVKPPINLPVAEGAEAATPMTSADERAAIRRSFENMRMAFRLLLRPPIVRTVHVHRDADALPFEHARDEPGPAADLDSHVAEPPEDFDAGPIDKDDARQIETHRAARQKKIQAFHIPQSGPLRDEAP